MLALARGFNSGVERLRSTRHRRRPIFKLTYVSHFSMYCHQPLIEIKPHDLNICRNFSKVHLS